MHASNSLRSHKVLLCLGAMRLVEVRKPVQFNSVSVHPLSMLSHVERSRDSSHCFSEFFRASPLTFDLQKTCPAGARIELRNRGKSLLDLTLNVER